MADFHQMTSWELVSAGSARGDGEGEGGGEGKGWEAVPEPLPAARRLSASPGGALRRLLTKDGRMPAPRNERCAQPGGRLSSFALRR